MTTAVLSSPAELRFGAVPPDSCVPDISTSGGDIPSQAGGRFVEAPVGATVTASVVGDDKHFRVRDMFVLEWAQEAPPRHVPPGEGPPPRPSAEVAPSLGTIRVLQLAATVEGGGPISVAPGQILTIRVEYLSLGIEGAYDGVLEVTSDAWDAVSVPLSMFLAQVDTTCSDTLHIVQGNTSTLAVDITSTMGPALPVSFQMSTTQLHTGLSLTPTSVHLDPKQTLTVPLTFRADRDAPLGPQQVAIDTWGFRPRGIFVTADVRHAEVTVNPAASPWLRSVVKGVTLPVPLAVNLNGGADTDVAFTGVALPTGVSVANAVFPISTSGTVTVDIVVGRDAPDAFDLKMAWTAYAGEQAGSVIYHVLIPQPVTFETVLETGGLAALGGHASVTIFPDGTTRWWGRADDGSELDGYDFTLVAAVQAPATGRSLVFVHTGSVVGLAVPGDSHNDWDETHPVSAILRDHYDEFAAAGHLNTHLEYTSDIGSALEGLVDWLVKFAAGTVLGPLTGAIVFIGLEVGSLIKTGSLVPGARVVGSILWMAGPENTLFAIAAEGIASAGGATRDIDPAWYDWANGTVFQGTLPPRDRLVLTDTIGPDNRPFTFPRYDGKITLNMGSLGDPRDFGGGSREYGEVFIHELVHACQIAHTGDLSLLAEGLAAKICEFGGGNPYAYGAPDQDFTHLGLEQQAQIVGNWYAGQPTSAGQTGTPMDQASPYFHYIVDNLLPGLF